MRVCAAYPTSSTYRTHLTREPPPAQSWAGFHIVAPPLPKSTIFAPQKVPFAPAAHGSTESRCGVEVQYASEYVKGNAIGSIAGD